MKGTICWALAVLITLTSVVFQRRTGPSNPERLKTEVNGQVFNLSLPRSLVRPADLSEGALLSIPVKCSEEARESIIGAVVYYKRYPGNYIFKAVVPSFAVEDNKLLINANVPVQPAAGKIVYYVQLIARDGSMVNPGQATLRFRDRVPDGILIIHVLLMFAAMLFSTFSGLFALCRNARVNSYVVTTILTLFAGGFIFGPIVQKFAFGEYWTGWPFGEDLTDTKTMVALLFWLAAYIVNRAMVKKYGKPAREYIAAQTPGQHVAEDTEGAAGAFAAAGLAVDGEETPAERAARKLNRWKLLYVLAALLTLAVYSIPHSLSGSEYDYETNTIITGD